MKIATFLVFLLGCGSITPVREQLTAPDGAAGAAGGAAAGGAGGAGSSGGAAAAGTSGAAGVSGAAGAAGAAGAPCLPYNATGLAYNLGCSQDGGPVIIASCHANCEYQGAKFVGCAVEPAVDGGILTCYASCSECGSK